MPTLTLSLDFWQTFVAVALVDTVVAGTGWYFLHRPVRRGTVSLAAVLAALYALVALSAAPVIGGEHALAVGGLLALTLPVLIGREYAHGRDTRAEREAYNRRITDIVAGTDGNTSKG